jgi:hypothetical protein
MHPKKFKSIINAVSLGQTEDIELFNNIGQLDASEGRLTVWLTINPVPRLMWEFEFSRGEDDYNSLHPKKLSSWSGANPMLTIKNPYAIFKEFPSKRSFGYAEQALFGEMNEKANCFSLYLVNANFLRESTINLMPTTIDIDNEPLVIQHRPLDIELNNWSLSFYTKQKYLDWLKPADQNRGFMVLSQVSLIHKTLEFSLLDAHTIFTDLFWLLTYINGGYIQPIYVVAEKFISSEKSFKKQYIASLAQSCFISPQEELGQPSIAFGNFEDLSKFICCFPSFQKMLQSQHWKNRWTLLLEWYFQAIPKPIGRNKNSSLPVIANALGTLLEHLARIILVEEGNLSQTKFEDMRAKRRITELLAKLGIQEDESLIENFTKIRNNSTHSKQININLSSEEEFYIIQNAIQWVDEVILWRIGYGGHYYERTKLGHFGSPIAPRYDISLRDQNW